MREIFLKGYIEERAVEIANYIIEESADVNVSICFLYVFYSSSKMVSFIFRKSNN